MAKILVVDDEAIMRKLLDTLLTTAGHTVVAADRGDTALERLRSEPFDLLISDIRMQPVDGMEVLAGAKAARPSMPVILVTAYNSEETHRRARELGAFRYRGSCRTPRVARLRRSPRGVL